jgi:antitoxin component YwqK of YwqJK toxin-antitoxin module
MVKIVREIDMKHLIINGKSEGVLISFSSKHLSYFNYCNDEYNGKSIEYHSNNKIYKIDNYIQNSRNGKIRVYYDNGKIFNTGYIIDDLIIGEYNLYDTNGVLYWSKNIS